MSAEYFDTNAAITAIPTLCAMNSKQINNYTVCIGICRIAIFVSRVSYLFADMVS